MKKINFIKKLTVFFVFLFIQNNINAQAELVDVSTRQSLNTNTSVVTNSLNIPPVLNANSTTSETVLSPENQGFDKMTINGKTVYMKKIDNVIIEYKPE